MGKQILVVDDDKEFLEEFCDALKANGYDTRGVDNPMEVIPIISHGKPDLILLDMKMPLKTGYEVLLSMDYFTGFHHIPVIVMSAYFKNETSYLFDRFNVKFFLKKPFSVDEVMPRIKEALEETTAS